MQGVSRKGWGWLRECSSEEGRFAVRWAYFIVGMEGWLRGRSSGEGSFAVRWAYFMGDGGGYADAVRDRNPSPTGGTTFR